jgi:general secretion pathway protein B
MSYILEALKKSDQERKQGEIPTLESDHADLTFIYNQRAARRKKRLILLSSVCIAIIAVGLWQWRSQADIPGLTGDTAPDQQTAVVTEPASEPTVQAAGPNVADQVSEPAQEPAQVTAPAQKSVPPQPLEQVQKETGTAPVTIGDLTVMSSAGEIEPDPQMQAEQQQPPSPAPVEAGSEPDGKLPLLSELPAAQQKAIPAIKMAGHVYAEQPARRMIIINNKIVREGERVGDNLKLIRITWDGIILSHNNTVFQIKM